MTIIYDMANGSIQSDIAPETGGPDGTTLTEPVAEPRLAQVETHSTPHEYDNPQTAIHIIRGLLSSG